MEVAKDDVLPMYERTHHEEGKFFNFKFIY